MPNIIINEIKGGQIVKRKTLRSKLIPILIFLAVVPSIVASAFIITQNYLLIIKQTENLTHQIAVEKASYIDDFMSKMINQTNIIANTPSVLQGNEQGIKDTIKAVKESDKDFMNTYVGTEDKVMILYPEQKLPDGYDPTSRPWYKDAVNAGGKPVVTPPYKDASTGRDIVSIAIAIKLANGKNAVVASDIDVSSLMSKIAATKVGHTGFASLLTSDGIILAHPDSKLLMQKIQEKYSWGKDIVEKKDGSGKFKMEKSSGIMSYAQSKITGWIVTASMPGSEYTGTLVSSLSVSVLIILLVLAAAIFIGFKTANYVAKPISSLLNVIKKAEEGDFSVEVKSSRNDEVGLIENSFGNFVNVQRTVISSIVNSSSELLSSAENIIELSDDSVKAIDSIKASIEEIQSSTQSNASSLEEANAGVEEMASNAQLVASSVQKVKEKSELSVKIAHEGYASVDAAAKSMDEIKEFSKNVVDVVNQLFSASKEINVIVNTITSIASQTNLLALNAAIEAARAGEAGRGFSVVAEEVRKLAEESSSAAKSIGDLISDIQSKIDEAVKTTEKEVALVEEGTENALRVKASLDEIINSINSLNKYIEEVSAAAEEQSASTQEMSAVINSISNAIEETVKSTEDMAGSINTQSQAIVKFEESAKNLEAIAEKLSSQVKRFKI